MRPDIVIAGAGLIGMSCALECSRRGLHVTLLEAGRVGLESSWAAAGMLAAHDPANPAALRPLSEHSITLYPDFLAQLAEESGRTVPFETAWTLQEDAAGYTDAAPVGLSSTGFRQMSEWSLDPRKLVAAVAAAVKARGITLLEGQALQALHVQQDGAVCVRTSGGILHSGLALDCTGAWSKAHVRPAKGQMLRLHAPGTLRAAELGDVVVRTHLLYLVPRLDGSVVVGATVEDAGFNKTIESADIDALRQRAVRLLPNLEGAPVLERWAGLRPRTADELPLLGPVTRDERRIFVASGHFRNGVLLAPATAHVMVQLLLGEAPAVDLSPFSPSRDTLSSPA